MKVKSLHKSFIMPTKGTDKAGAYDIYMPEDGYVSSLSPTMVGLGFSTEIPEGYVALILPRSGVGANSGLELNNTCGVIDSDYRGEWKAALKTKNVEQFSWIAGQRLLQFLLIPVLSVNLELCDELPSTKRAEGGFGSTNQ